MNFRLPLGDPEATVPDSAALVVQAFLRSPDRHRYFRCHPLQATISVVQCRINRVKLTAAEAMQLPYEPHGWEMMPRACAGCMLSLAVDALRVPIYTAEEVLAGKARAEVPDAPARPMLS